MREGVVGRPRTEPGHWGNIRYKVLSRTKVRAFAQYATGSGRVRQVEATGRSKKAAQIRLENHLEELRRTEGGVDLDASATVADLVEAWRVVAAADTTRRRVQSMDKHEYAIRHTITDPNVGIGTLRVSAATTARLRAWLFSVSDPAPSRGRDARTVLNMAFDLAVASGQLSRNPVAPVHLPRRSAPVVEALSVAEARQVRVILHDYADAGHYRMRRALADIVDLMLATGMRVGEATGLRWCDVDLDSEIPTVTAAGTTVHIRHQPVRRQDRLKSDDGFRTIALVKPVVAMMERRRAARRPTTTDAVFPSSVGTWWDSHNLRRLLRDAFDWADADRIHPHLLRRTMATLIDSEVGVENASKILGHSGVGITEQYYIAHAAVAPDMRSVTEALFAEPEEASGQNGRDGRGLGAGPERRDQKHG
jgi:integrase